MPAFIDSGRPAALMQMVGPDSHPDWLRSQPVDLESYLRSLAELGTVETAPAEQILAEYERRRRSGESPDLAQLIEQFPQQLDALHRLIAQKTQESAADSVLGQLSDRVARHQQSPAPLPRDTKAAPKLPHQFGRYRLLEQLGQGAMGTVYLARDTQLHRQVALKVPHARGGECDEATNRRVLDRFYHEAHAAAILRHPNLCPVYDVGKIDGTPYLTMAYIKGRPLSQYIDPNRPLSLRWAAILVRKLAVALQAAHDKGVVHRDLKPSNVMICAGREPMIMDFGLAWRLDRRDGDERLTRLGLVLGTPAYMSPEQLSGRVEDLGPQCDVYSLGVILYELLTGRCPFEGPEAVVLAQVLFVQPERPSNHRPNLDHQLEAICLKAMTKRENERYASMSELAAALSLYLRRGSSAVRSPSATIPSAPKAPKDSQAQTRMPTVPANLVHATRASSRPSSGPVNQITVPVLAPAGLLKSWRRWRRTVESIALRRKSRRFWDHHSFTALRHQLLATLRERAKEAHEPERDFYLALEQLVIPWLSLQSLAREDREILHDLLARCHQVEWILEHRTAGVAARGWLVPVTLALVVISALLFWVFLIR
jgi:serine/threonine protein kinase